MDRHIRLSIIVPVYNVENYLRECIDSILNQQVADMEVILVDDGSPDMCGTICDEYAEKDKRVTVIHKENGGLSSARNAGLDIAQGKYITFVDSDDYLLPNTYSPNLEYIEEHLDIDCLQFPAIYDERIVYTKNYKRINTERTFAGNEVFLNWWSGKLINHFVWNKIFKREMWNELRFDVGAFVEDALLVPKLAKKCQRLHISMEGGYFYRYTEGSLSNSGWTERNYVDFFKSRLVIWNLINELEYMDSARIKAYLVTIKWLAVCSQKGYLNYNDYDKFLNSLPPIRLLPKSMELELKWCLLYIVVKILGTRGLLKLYFKVKGFRNGQRMP